MYLKKIVISGFKSFADKVTINLDKEHITGVVGPNGSGKSNVIDSVRWVMGEQNAKMLRGEKATDIIFAGSQKRKSLGMAEVTLVFDNAESSSFCPPEYRHEPEISLTRRLYIDGQREYFINKKACRLKDIVGFFNATGLGGRSYSIIQQGQVDRILQAKPEQLREMIEEAAGTLIFKKHRNEADKKLAATRLNLSRIDDILVEVERQKEALQEQVEKAKKYKAYSEDLYEKELELLSHNYRSFKEKLTDVEEALKELSQRDIDLIADLTEFEASQEELQAQLDEADPEVMALNETISVLRERIARAEADLINANQLLDSGDERLSAIDKDIAEEDRTLKELELQAEEKQKQLSVADEQVKTLKDQLETFQFEMESALEETQVFTNKIEECEDELKNLDRLIESNKIREENISHQFAEAEKSKILYKNKLVSFESDIAKSMILLDAAQVKVAGRKKGLDSDIQEKHDRQAAINARVDEIRETAVKRDLLKEEYLNTKAKYTSLQELEANASDVASIATKIKENSGVNHAIEGLLTDYISFNETADELSGKARSVFEKWAERIIVSGLDEFNDLVRVVHDEGVGGLPVSLLSSLDDSHVEAISKWAENYDAEPFSTYVNVNSDIRGVKQLVSRLYHLPTLMLDDDVLKDLPQGVLVISSQGVLFSEQSDFFVGSEGGKGALSRKHDLEDLGEEVKTLESQLASIQGKVDSLEAQQNEDYQVIREIDVKLQEQNQAVMEVMAELQSAQQQVDMKNEQIQSSRDEFKKLEESCDRYSEELEELKKNKESLSLEKEQIAMELEEVQEHSSSLIERRDELTQLTGQKKIDLAKIEASYDGLRGNYRMVSDQMETLQNRLSRRYQEKEEIVEKIQSAKSDKGTLEQDIEGFILQREQKEEILASKREENAGIIEELRVVENKLRDLRAEQQKSQKKNSDRSLELERLKLGISSVCEQAVEKYQIELENYEFETNHNFDATVSQRAVTTIRNKLDGMGAINMMAIEEYEELTSRESFIHAQKDEVISSIDLLETAIEEIELNSETKFMQAFKTLGVEFSELFPILFPGGDAHLLLTNEESPLDGGVEILVRLPGKKQQNMRLFSGGEKALTAIALIFALLKSKPTPFCFLDEVDAPLDETNVGRYNRVLSALAERFQFIVITHNRRTMEILDTLFGVTMQEPGVSKVVGVDMSKDLPAHLKKAFKPTSNTGATLRIDGATAESS